ncbi:MAG: hypothetical protein LC753_02050 [Acidobacteria bacterium]|nr:hypothetical protein [Acidobacteriota bacterium]MCA1649087.1 hypothetical protein [Acidobacteriota bacterium]
MTRETSDAGIIGVAPGETKEKDLSWLDYSLARDLSADGTTLLIEEGAAGGGAAHGIHLRPMDGSAAIKLGDGIPLGLSPDKKWVLSVPANGEQLVVVPTGVGEPRVLERHSIERYRLSAAWFPDGKRVIFRANASGQADRIFVQDVAAGPPHPITPEGIAGGLALSPDATQIAVRDTKRQHWLFSVEGGEPRPLSSLGPRDHIIRWGVDGRILYFTTSPVLPERVYQLDVTTGRKQLWKQLAPPDLAGVWAIESILMTPDAKAYAYTYLRRLSELYLVEGLK